MDKFKFLPRAVLIFFALILIFSLFSGSFVTIDPGEKGIIFRRFGGGLDKEKNLGQGFHVVAPWNKVYRYNVRIQEQLEKMHVLTSNGLSVDIDMSVRYQAMPDRVAFIHDEVGREYLKTIIIPEVRSSTRKVVGQYTPEELYSTKRDAIQTEVYAHTRKALEEKNIILDAVLIREIKLPPKIKAAIERKLEQEQQSQEYAFRIEKETKEKERKRIEAEGIEQYQTIVSRSLSDRLPQMARHRSHQRIV